jgi:hypothetical protein
LQDKWPTQFNSFFHALALLLALASPALGASFFWNELGDDRNRERNGRNGEVQAEYAAPKPVQLNAPDISAGK